MQEPVGIRPLIITHSVNSISSSQNNDELQSASCASSLSQLQLCSAADARRHEQLPVWLLGIGAAVQNQAYGSVTLNQNACLILGSFAHRHEQSRQPYDILLGNVCIDKGLSGLIAHMSMHLQGAFRMNHKDLCLCRILHHLQILSSQSGCEKIVEKLCCPVALSS